MRRNQIRHAVWPTGAPPVCTAQWDQAAWDRFAEGFRPLGYDGDIFDEDAWTSFQLRRASRIRDRLQTWINGQEEENDGLDD